MKKKKVKKAPKKSLAKRVEKALPSPKATVHYKILGDSPEEKTFVLHDGRKLKNVYELIDELETMSEETFRQYVNEFRNDFANWLKDVFDGNHIADDIQRTYNRIDAQRVLLKHLVRELKKLSESKK